MNDLEEKLVRDRWVSPNELIRAKQEQKKTKKSLFSSLINLDYLKEEDVFAFFAINSGIPFVKLTDYAIKDDVLALLPQDFCRRSFLIPLFKIEGTLFVAMANPLNAELLMNLEARTELNIYPLTCSPYAIFRALDKYFGFEDNFFEMEKLIFKSQELQKFPFHRESERVPLNVPIEVKIFDVRVALTFSQTISTSTTNVSLNGKGLGIKAHFFIPQGAALVLNFISSEGKELKVKGEVAHCQMKKRGEFFIGVRCPEPSFEVSTYLRGLVGKNNNKDLT